MATILGIDEELLREAVRLGKKRTKGAAGNEALREYVDRRKRLAAIKLFGTVDFCPDCDYLAEREKR